MYSILIKRPADVRRKFQFVPLSLLFKTIPIHSKAASIRMFSKRLAIHSVSHAHQPEIW